jgi:hypothetical protein
MPNWSDGDWCHCPTGAQNKLKMPHRPGVPGCLTGPELKKEKTIALPAKMVSKLLDLARALADQMEAEKNRENKDYLEVKLLKHVEEVERYIDKRTR